MTYFMTHNIKCCQIESSEEPERSLCFLVFTLRMCPERAIELSAFDLDNRTLIIISLSVEYLND